MASVDHTEYFDCKVSDFFKVIQDCESYSEFLADVKSCKILEDHGSRKIVEYKISVVKTFTYINEHIEEEPNRLSFRFLEGDLFKTMEGSWDLKEESGKTRADYRISASFGLFIPGAMTKKVIGANLPAMMRAYQQRVSEKL